MYEEIEMIKYYVKTKSYANVFNMLLSPLLYPIGSNIDGFDEFLNEYDPRG